MTACTSCGGSMPAEILLRSMPSSLAAVAGVCRSDRLCVNAVARQNGEQPTRRRVSRHAGAQQVVEVYDADRLAVFHHDELGLLRRVEQLERLADQLIRPHRDGLARQARVDRVAETSGA